MPRIIKRRVDALKPGSKPIWDSELKGFGVRVSAKGTKSYLVVYRPKPGGRDQPKRWYVIGPHGSPWTVERARNEAKRILGLVAAGEDPQADRMAARKGGGKTIKELVPEYLEAKKGQRSAGETKRILNKDLVPVLGKKRPEDVGRKDIKSIIDTVEKRGPVMAGRTLAHIRRFFRWCVEKEHIEANPAGAVESPEKPTSRERVLTDSELAEAWKASEAIGWPWDGFVQMLILTAQRRNEVARMRWDEIEGDTWTIPASRTKNKREHKVPLTVAAMAVIKAQPRQEAKKGKKRVPCPFVFSTNAEAPISGFSKAKRRIDQKIHEARVEAVRVAGGDPEKVNAMPHWTYHDLRRTAVTGMARLGIHPHVADAVLNHKEGVIRGVAAVYQRHRYEDEARRALEAWEGHVLGVVSGEVPATNVVSLAERSA